MSTVTLDTKTIVTWLTIGTFVVGGMGTLLTFGLPASMSYVVKAEEQIGQNTRRSLRNKAAISKYSGFVTKLQRDQAVQDAYQQGVQRDLTDAKQERKDLDKDLQKIIRLLGSTR